MLVQEPGSAAQTEAKRLRSETGPAELTSQEKVRKSNPSNSCVELRTSRLLPPPPLPPPLPPPPPPRLASSQPQPLIHSFGTINHTGPCPRSSKKVGDSKSNLGTQSSTGSWSRSFNTSTCSWSRSFNTNNGPTIWSATFGSAAATCRSRGSWTHRQSDGGTES